MTVGFIFVVLLFYLGNTFFLSRWIKWWYIDIDYSLSLIMSFLFLVTTTNFLFYWLVSAKFIILSYIIIFCIFQFALFILYSFNWRMIYICLPKQFKWKNLIGLILFALAIVFTFNVRSNLEIGPLSQTYEEAFDFTFYTEKINFLNFINFFLAMFKFNSQNAVVPVLICTGIISGLFLAVLFNFIVGRASWRTAIFLALVFAFMYVFDLFVYRSFFHQDSWLVFLIVFYLFVLFQKKPDSIQFLLILSTGLLAVIFSSRNAFLIACCLIAFTFYHLLRNKIYSVHSFLLMTFSLFLSAMITFVYKSNHTVVIVLFVFFLYFWFVFFSEIVSNKTWSPWIYKINYFLYRWSRTFTYLLVFVFGIVIAVYNLFDVRKNLATLASVVDLFNKVLIWDFKEFYFWKVNITQVQIINLLIYIIYALTAALILLFRYFYLKNNQLNIEKFMVFSITLLLNPFSLYFFKEIELDKSIANLSVNNWLFFASAVCFLSKIIVHFKSRNELEYCSNYLYDWY